MGVETKEKVAAIAQLTPADYVHLHNHTHHSLLDGLTKVPDLVARVKSLGMNAVAMTDHGTLSGAIEFDRNYNKINGNTIFIIYLILVIILRRL